jgi:diadenosine tetraphosphatase ApaH/serine/threonine PP2A family protein phosphatase
MPHPAITVSVSRQAVLYDVHGNLLALEAVIEDARRETVGRFVFGGDYALFGPRPAETVAMLRELPDARWIRGNVDRWSADPSQAPDDELLQAAIADCRSALGPDVTQELAALPEQAVVDGVRYCHASPISDLRSFMPDAAAEDDELLGGVAERRVVFGHTHLQFRRIRDDGVELLNPGSVGLPFDGDHRAAYALIDDSGAIELRRVRYDHEASAEAVEGRFARAPWAQRSARRLRSAQLVE